MHIHNTIFCFILFILGVSFCAVSAWPQEPAFRIDSYIPQYFTDFQWRLEGNLWADGFRQEVRTRLLDEGKEYEKITSFDRQTIDILSDINYRYETIPRFFDFTVQGAYTLSNRNPHDYHIYRYDFNPGIYPTVDAGYYLHSDLLAFLSGNAGWLYDHNLHDVNPDVRTIVYTVDAATGLGWGRVYDGRFTATALYIVDDLKSNGILNRMPTHEEMDSLTKIVYTRRLESYDDSRLHRIASLLSIMKFLESRGIIAPSGPYAYLLIQDIWDYFPNDARRFGWTMKGGLGLDYYKRLVQTTDEQEDEPGSLTHTYKHETRVNQQPYILARGEYYKPFGLRWQVNAVLEGKYFFSSYYRYRSYQRRYQPYQSTSVQEDRENYSDLYQVAAEIQLTYILDSRTRAGLTVENSYSHSESDHRNLHRIRKENNLTCQAAIEYRITIPTTLAVSVEYRRRDLNDQRSSTTRIEDIMHFFSYLTSVRLIHYLF